MPSTRNTNPDAVQEENGNPTQRRGPKGHFQGSRKQFLNSHLPAYLESKKGGRQAFWHKVYSKWWQRFPWKLDDDKEPPTDDPAKMIRLASVAPGEEEMKKQVEARLTNRLKTWFSNQASSSGGSRRDTAVAWLPLLQRLHQIRNPRPRRRTAAQQFMQDYPQELNAAFVSRHGDGKNLSSSERLNLRAQLAKSMVSGQFSHLVKDLEQKAAKQHEKDMKEWDLILEDISEASDISATRDSLFDAVHPLLQAIGSYANCYVSLVVGDAGKGESDQGFFTAVHWWPGDRVQTKSWTQWDPEAFNSGVAGPFLKYAAETNQTLRVHQSQDLIAIDKTSNISASPALDDTSNPAPEDSRSTGITAITPTGPANITTNKLRYRALPPRDELSTRIPTTRKRKHASTLKGSRPIRYFEGSSSEDEGGGDQSGDGSSSGDSIVFEGPTKTKRQRTSGIVTRSSVRTPAPDVSNGESSESASLTPTTSTPSSTVTTSATAVVDETAPSDTTIPAQPDATNPQLTGAADTGLVGPPIAGPPHAESTITPVTGPEPVAITGTELAATVTGLTVGGSPHRVHRRVF